MFRPIVGVLSTAALILAIASCSDDPDCPTECGAWCAGQASSECKNPGCRCEEPCSNEGATCCDPFPGDGPNYCKGELTCCGDNQCRATCGNVGGDGGGDSEMATPCTPESQGVSGTQLAFDSYEFSHGHECQLSSTSLLTNKADVDAAFPVGAPAALANVDFAVDRVVLGSSNPALKFAVDDGTDLVVLDEGICQGMAPSCVAYVVKGTQRNTVRVLHCPYAGPDPCLAP